MLQTELYYKKKEINMVNFCQKHRPPSSDDAQDLFMNGKKKQIIRRKKRINTIGNPTRIYINTTKQNAVNFVLRRRICYLN